jgi:hypothetical protein
MSQRTFFPGYCIDTNALIDLWRRFYPSDIFPSLWKDLEDLILKDCLIAPHEVLNELEKWDDGLLKWAKNHKRMFKDLDYDQMQQVGKILKDFPNLVDPNKTTPDADPFVIGLAISKDWTVVTSEKPSTGGRPKIPDVCKKYNMKCISLLEFFREQKWTY